MKLLVPAATLLLAGAAAHAQPPACAHWPTSMATVHLKNAGVLDPATLDQAATTATLLAAQPLGHNLYKEIYDITFHDRAGRTLEVLTSNEASNEECSMSAVDVWVISRHLGDR